MTWEETLDELRVLKLKMDDIYDQFPGKENRKIREQELRPVQLRCVEIGYVRYKLIEKKNKFQR